MKTDEQKRDTAQVIVEMVRMMASTYRIQTTPEMVAAYTQILGDLEPVVIQQAFGVAFRECVFVPKPAEIRKFAGLTDTLLSEAAWSLVIESVKRYGVYAGYDFGAVTNATVRSIGGIKVIGGLDAFTTKDARARFLSAWARNSHSVISEESGRYLCGAHVDQPVFVLTGRGQKLLGGGDV